MPISIYPLLLLQQRQLITHTAIFTLDELPSSRSRGNLQLAESIISCIQHSSNVENGLVRRQFTMRFDISSHSIDDVSDRFAFVGVVSVVILDGSSVDGAVGAKGEETLVPMDVAGKVSIDAVFEHQLFESVADVLLVGGRLTAVHGTMTIDEDPGSLFAVDGSEIFGQPLVLFISFVVFPVVVVDATERTAVGDEGLCFGRQSLVAFDVTGEGPFGAVGEVRLGVDTDEMGETVVEGVPEVADTATFLSGHAEAVLEGCEVPGM